MPRNGKPTNKYGTSYGSMLNGSEEVSLDNLQSSQEQQRQEQERRQKEEAERQEQERRQKEEAERQEQERRQKEEAERQERQRQEQERRQKEQAERQQKAEEVRQAAIGLKQKAYWKAIDDLSERIARGSVSTSAWAGTYVKNDTNLRLRRIQELVNLEMSEHPTDNEALEKTETSLRNDIMQYRQVIQKQTQTLVGQVDPDNRIAIQVSLEKLNQQLIYLILKQQWLLNALENNISQPQVNGSNPFRTPRATRGGTTN